MVRVIEKGTALRTKNRVWIAADPVYMASLQFYQYIGHLKGVSLVPILRPVAAINQVPGCPLNGCDYYVMDQRKPFVIDREGLSAIYQGPSSASLVAVPS